MKVHLKRVSALALVLNKAILVTLSQPSAPLAPPGYPVATNEGHEWSFGFAWDQTNFLALINDTSTFPSNITAQLISPKGEKLGSRIILGGPGGGMEGEFDGTNYLVLWEQRFYNQYDIQGQFVSREGLLVGEAFPVCTWEGNQQFDSRRALEFDGTNYLVVWRDGGFDPTEFKIFGQLISRAGDLVGSEIAIATDPGNQLTPSVLFDGTNYLVTWMSQRSDSPSDLFDAWGIFISRAGTLVSEPFQISEFPSPRYVQVNAAFNGQHYLVVWNRDLSAGEEYPAEWDVSGRLLNTFNNPSGRFAGGERPLVAPTGNQVIPNVFALGDDFLVSWLDGYGGDKAVMRARFFSDSGAPMGLSLDWSEQVGSRIPFGPFACVGNRVALILSWLVMPYSDWVIGPATEGDVYAQLFPLPTRLHVAGDLPAGAFQCRVNGFAGQTNIVQVSEDFETWSDWLTTNTPGASFIFTDGESGHTQRFYRVVVP